MSAPSLRCASVEADFFALQDHGNHEVRFATFDEALKDENREMNRVVDVVPFDANLASGREYFNASIIGDGLAIAAQRPDLSTSVAFRKMVEDREIETIVSLDSSPNGYWLEATVRESFQVHGCTIETRRIRFEEGARSITHYQLNGKGLAQEEMGDVLIAMIKKVASCSSDTLLVHCASGAARTGVFLAGYIAYTTENPNLLEIAKGLRCRRTGRMSMIPSLTQYEIAHRITRALTIEESADLAGPAELGAEC